MARILIPFQPFYTLALYMTKILVFQKIGENILQLLICTALSAIFLLVKLLQVAYIPRSFERFAIHSLEVEWPQPGL